METLSMTPARRLEGVRAYGRAAEAFETVAWRPPSSARFEMHVANDAPASEPGIRELAAEIPGWVTIVAGGLVAALTGALVGGMLAL